MIAKSTVSALRALSYLSQTNGSIALPPRLIAEALNESPSYLAKVMRHLVKSGILRAEKGVKGGLRMNRPPSRITLLDIVESCQGTIHEDHCSASPSETSLCSFHEAALELHHALCGVLSRWTLTDLLEKPVAKKVNGGKVVCFMAKDFHAPAPPGELVSVPQKKLPGGRRR